MRSFVSFLVQILAGAICGFLLSFVLPGTGRELVISAQQSQTVATVTTMTPITRALVCATFGAILAALTYIIPSLRIMRR